ncbi:MAG: segregation/condensation protein A [Patescibacteria group bacterium]|jgi:segregation and condensation protein A|nr:segregation/condensation protein A [Patescibacteria group bacterium]
MTEIKIEQFSGPLGLLLSLIQSEELDITEVSLAKIADDYVNYVKNSDEIEPEETADFLLIAAKLLYIKSKALLPYLYHDDEEDDAKDLEKQLKMYKEFVTASLKIKELLLKDSRSFIPPLSKNNRANKTIAAFRPPKKLKADDLKDCYKSLLEVLDSELEKRREVELSSETLEPKVSIDEKIDSIRKLLGKKIKLSFSKFLNESKSKTEVIVGFLAVLELAKQKELYFEQDELFSDILINSFNKEE